MRTFHSISSIAECFLGAPNRTDILKFSFYLVLLMSCSCGGNRVETKGSDDFKKMNKELSQVKIQRNIQYSRRGELPLYLDLYRPEPSVKKPKLLVWFHGGGWRSGSKDECRISWMAENGYAVASVQYRLSVQAIFPAQIYDCKEAIRWLRAHAEKYGYDATKIGVAGISSGGHLATLLGVTGDSTDFEEKESPYKNQSARVHAVLNLCGASDFIRVMKHFPQAADDPKSTLGLLFGGPFSEKHELAKLASPSSHVTEGDPPLLLVHGTDDPIVPYDQSEYLRDLYNEKGLQVKLITIKDGPHVPLEFWDETRRTQYLQFFEKHLKN